MGMNREDAYYEPEEPNDMDAAISGRTIELLNTAEYDPTDVYHMAEAIAEASEADQQIIRDYIANGDWHKLGMKLYYMSHEYMEKFAESRAIDQYNQGLLHD